MLLPRYWAAAGQLLPQCDLPQLALLLHARIKLGCMPSAAWSTGFWHALQLKLPAVASAPGVAMDSSTWSSAAAGVVAGELQLQLQERERWELAQTGQQHVQQQQQQQQAAPSAGGPASGQLSAPADLSPAAVVGLVWAAGELWTQAPVPLECLQRLLGAAVLVVPQLRSPALAALGLGLLAMHRAAVRAEKAQAAAPASAQGRRGRNKEQQQEQQDEVEDVEQHAGSGQQVLPAALRQLCRPLWTAWFDRGTQLLLADAATQSWAAGSSPAAQPQGHRQMLQGQQQHQRQHQQQQQQQQQMPDVDSLSLQLRVACVLWLSPPAAWCEAVLRVAPRHISSSSMEQLSWLLPDLVRLQQLQGARLRWWQYSKQQQQQQELLPPGLAGLCISRATVLMADLQQHWVPDPAASRLMQWAQMLRLQSAVKQLRAASSVGDAEWAQWQRLQAGWRASQGLAEGRATLLSGCTSLAA